MRKKDENSNLFEHPIAVGGIDALTLGASPKIQGALAALLRRTIDPELVKKESFYQTYERGRDIARKKSNEIMSENPVQSFLGGLVGGAGVAKGLSTIPGLAGYLNPSSIKHAAALGAGYGGVYGGLSNDEDPFSGAGQGAIQGAATGGAIQGLAPLFSRGANNVSKGLDYIDSNYLGNKGKGIIESTGMRMPQFDDRQGSLTPDQIRNISLGKKFGVPLTKGEISQSDLHRGLEEGIASGLQGPAAERLLKESQQKGMQEFHRAALDTRGKLGGDIPFTESGASLQPSIMKIKDEYNAITELKDQAYKVAKDNKTFLDPKGLKGFTKDVSKLLHAETLDMSNAPKAFNELARYKKFISERKVGKKGINFNVIEAYRQSLNNTLSESSGRDKAGLQIIKKEFDTFLDNTIEKALVTGDPKVLEQFKHARKLHADRKEEFTKAHKDEFGRKFIEDIVGPSSKEELSYKMLANRMLGASEYGFKPEADAIVGELQRRLGENSPEFNGIKLEIANKLTKPLLANAGEGVNFNNSRVQTYKNNLRTNEAFLKKVFSESEFKDLGNLGDLGALKYQSKKSVINPPQSGLMQKLLSTIPYGKGASELLHNWSGTATAKNIIHKGEESLMKESIPKFVLPKDIGLPVNAASNQLLNKLSLPRGPIEEERKPLSSLSDEELNLLEKQTALREMSDEELDILEHMIQSQQR